MKKFKSLVFIFIFFVFTNFSIYACTCGGSTVKESYINANAIVIAKVIKIREREIDEKGFYKTNQLVNLKVKKSFKGNNYKNIVISQGNSTCDWIFDEDNLNKNYLFYLAKTSEKTEQFRVISCSRSNLLENSIDEISWLSKLPESLNRTRISGTAQISDEDYLFPPLANVKLKITGENNIINLITDKNGFFEVWDITIGEYKIEAEIPKEYSLRLVTTVFVDENKYWSADAPDESQLTFKVKDNDSVGINFMFERKKDEK